MGATRDELAVQGRLAVEIFCLANDITIPRIYQHNPGDGSCGLYEKGCIYVHTPSCARPGYGGPAWSWPGYIVDRTPYGVHCHELGHMVDDIYRWRLGREVRRATGEDRLTGYCPNTAEWWAEMFRLFVTNPHLLSLIRPRTYEAMLAWSLRQVEDRSWDEVLTGAPQRTIDMAERRINEARN